MQHDDPSLREAIDRIESVMEMALGDLDKLNESNTHPAFMTHAEAADRNWFIGKVWAYETALEILEETFGGVTRTKSPRAIRFTYKYGSDSGVSRSKHGHS